MASRVAKCAKYSITASSKFGAAFLVFSYFSAFRFSTFQQSLILVRCYRQKLDLTDTETTRPSFRVEFCLLTVGLVGF